MEHVLARLKSLLGARYPRLVLRMVATVVCFAVAIVLTVLPGPAFVFWILGFMFLGFGAGQILLSLHAVQEWMHRKVPLANRFPRLRKGHIRKVLRHRWIQMLDGLSGHRESRARRRAARRVARSMVQAHECDRILHPPDRSRLPTSAGNQHPGTEEIPGTERTEPAQRYGRHPRPRS